MISWILGFTAALRAQSQPTFDFIEPNHLTCTSKARNLQDCDPAVRNCVRPNRTYKEGGGDFIWRGANKKSALIARLDVRVKLITSDGHSISSAHHNCSIFRLLEQTPRHFTTHSHSRSHLLQNITANHAAAAFRRTPRFILRLFRWPLRLWLQWRWLMAAIPACKWSSLILLSAMANVGVWSGLDQSTRQTRIARHVEGAGRVQMAATVNVIFKHSVWAGWLCKCVSV